MAGAARVEIYQKWPQHGSFSSAIRSGTPLKVATETTSESAATTAGDRIVCSGTGITPNSQYFALVSNSEACYVSIGADPTAAAASSFLLAAGVAREFPIKGGEKISFRDVA